MRVQVPPLCSSFFTLISIPASTSKFWISPEVLSLVFSFLTALTTEACFFKYRPIYQVIKYVTLALLSQKK